MATTLAIALTGSAIAIWLSSPRLRRSNTWRAMITPLASIIGSGFLVLGPLLDIAYGAYAPLVMMALCALAYLFGAAIRCNMCLLDTQDGQRGALEGAIETAASWALSFAYFISVAYYLNLFGAFGVSLTAVHTPFHARLLTSAMFLIILAVGWTRGFKSLESMEYAAVTAKLAIIAGMMVSLSAFVAKKAVAGQLVLNTPAYSGWPALVLAFDLIVTVQGFETSRYLGAEYDYATRVRSIWRN